MAAADIGTAQASLSQSGYHCKKEVLVIRSTHTYAILEVSQAAYDEIRMKLKAADYDHCFHEQDGRIVIDMHGIALAEEPTHNPLEAAVKAAIIATESPE
jgi:hypothetical protein